jgi:hypothetical protein
MTGRPPRRGCWRSGPRSRGTFFRHEALLYAGRREFLGRTVPFIREGLAGGDPIRVVVDAT